MNRKSLEHFLLIFVYIIKHKKHTITMKNIKLFLLATAFIGFTSCDSELTEQPVPAPELMKVSAVLSDENLITPAYTETLSNAKIYMTYDEVTAYDGSEPLLAADAREIRMYAISDGTYTNASGAYGYNLSDFDDATYTIIIYLISGADGEITVGDYSQTREPLVGNSGSMQWASPVGVSSLMQNKSTGDIISIETGNQDNNAIKISGGVENGENMTVKFSGGIFIMVGESHPFYPSYSGHAVLGVTAEIIDAFPLPSARTSNKRPEALNKLLNR